MLEVREVAPGMLLVAGTVNLATVAELRERLGEAVERAVADGMPILSVDLSGAELIDATGLGVLLGAHRKARRGGSRLRLVRLNPRLSTLLLVSRLYRVLDIDHASASGGPSAPVGVLPAQRRPALEMQPLPAV